MRDAVDFPLAGVAVALRREGDRLAGLRVAITGTNSAPLVVPSEGVTGGPQDAEAAATLAKAVQATANDALDHRRAGENTAAACCGAGAPAHRRTWTRA